MIDVRTPYRDFLAFWEVARGRPRAVQRRLWHERYAGRHPELFAVHDGVFTPAAEALDDALPRYDAVAATAEARFASLRIEETTAAVEATIGLPAHGRAIVFVGTFGPLAWCDPFDGAAAMFFALERMDRLDVNPSLVAHELTHLIHVERREGWVDFSPGLDLVTEGVATQVVRRLFPATPLEHLFAVADYPTFAAHAEAAWSWAVPELLRHFEPGDPEQYRRFFWPDWARATRDVPESFGYLVGDRVVAALLAEHSLADVVQWPAERALHEARRALEALA